MEDFDENEEMAAMMGFSSFGGTKKRKFDQTNSPKAKEEYSASGANSTELGVRTKASNEKQGGEGHIDVAFMPQQKASLPPPASGLASFLARGQELPEKPPRVAQSHQETANRTDLAASEMVSFGGPSIPRAELNTLRFGVKNEKGDTAYFLPSFVEDPWGKTLPSRM